HHAIPCNIVKRRQEVKKLGNQSLDGMFQKKQKSKEYSRDNILHAVAKFVVCDDQSLAVADKHSFRNCLVAMRPGTLPVDIPSAHDVSSYIHNSFINFIGGLKAKMQV
ncbi:uncharacterized protein EDB91DRAFT_1001295, partial [Suillus paluster]|uniref:uncharacterized protein n=1 Tax=Suillus paluster TaxID=48578 RepID=UPI001B87D17B